MRPRSCWWRAVPSSPAAGDPFVEVGAFDGHGGVGAVSGVDACAPGKGEEPSYGSEDGGEVRQRRTGESGPAGEKGVPGEEMTVDRQREPSRRVPGSVQDLDRQWPDAQHLAV